MAAQGNGTRRPDDVPLVRTTAEGDAVVVRLAGELDLYNAPQVRAALTDIVEAQPARVVIDLSAVDFIDSTALGVLIESRAKLPNRQAFLLAAPAIETRRALQVSGLDRHLRVHDSVEDALAAAI